MPQTKIYVGNLPWSYTGEDLEKMFAEFGTVRSSSVISDRDTGRSRGFGFVEMDSVQEAEAAIQALGNTEIEGRTIRVNLAHEREPRSGGGGPRGGDRGGNRGGGRGGYGGGGGRGGDRD
jgi:RNA recognition motif-containing protein